jgi:putative salt-induced outer membrane protein YdiY
MKHLLLRMSSVLTLGTLLSLTASLAQADVIETKNGARLTGKVVKMDGTTLTLETDYAGTLAVKQSEVVSVKTEAPLNYRLAAGTVLQGTVSTVAGGQIQISGPEGSVTTGLDKVAATWAPGATDPAIVALQRAWSYEAALDVTGKTGNKEQSGTALSFRAVLAGSQDTLQFYSAYDRQISDGQKSADQFKAGVDYANNFSGRKSWYVRDEGGFDRIKDIDIYNVAAAGMGYDFIKEAKQTLTGRAGLSFRYEGYKNPASEDVKSAGLDFGLNHRLEMANSALVNRLSFVPSFDDFGNYRFIHESFYELPLANPSWKMRFGVMNDYNSQPGKGVDKLDTSYFTRLVLNWK